MGKRKTNEEFLKEVYEKNEYVRRGDIEVLSEYVGVDTKIECRCIKHNYTYFVAPCSLLKNIGCKKCGRERTTEKQRKTHEQFVKEVQEIAPEYQILSNYIGAFSPVDFQCPKGHVFSMRPVDFLHNERCPYCASRKILIGFNDIATTRPDVSRLFTDPNDGYRYMEHSGQKVNFTCPLCGTIQPKTINSVSSMGFACVHCSDHLSYPNRFGRALFDQLPVKYYDAEWRPKWAGLYRYDVHFELNSRHFVVEWDGPLHFDEDEKFGKSYEERHAKDIIKNELAKQNNIHMIRIDCIKSECEYIKRNIMNSELANLFDLSNIDWGSCDKHAHKNLIKEACLLYMNVNKDYRYIAKALHISTSTARQYIHKGVKLGWCEYDQDKLERDRQIRHGFAVSVIDINNVKTYNFNSMNSCVNWLSNVCGVAIDYRTIKKYIDAQKPYRGFLFNYIQPTIQN